MLEWVPVLLRRHYAIAPFVVMLLACTESGPVPPHESADDGGREGGAGSESPDPRGDGGRRDAGGDGGEPVPADAGDSGEAGPTDAAASVDAAAPSDAALPDPSPCEGQGSSTQGCDDGNDESDDGCSEYCEIESGWDCYVPGRPCARNDPACGETACTHGAGCIEPSGLGCRCESPETLSACENVRLRSLAFPPHTNRMDVSAVSADGSTVVGDAWLSTLAGSLGGPDFHAWTWSLTTGLMQLPEAPTVVIEAYAPAVSADGAIVLLRRANTVSLWSAEGSTALPFASAIDMSDDGTVVVGNDGTEAFLWTAVSGTTSLGHLPAQERSSPRAVSGDGLVVVGSSGTKAFRWSQSEDMREIVLPFMDGEAQSAHAMAVDRDGSVILGCISGGGDTRMWRFTAPETAEEIGTLEGEGSSTCEGALSADGAIAVGSSHGKAFVWDAVHGMRSLAAVLEDAGIDTAGWRFEQATAISADGKVIAGEGVLDDRQVGFVTWLP